MRPHRSKPLRKFDILQIPAFLCRQTDLIVAAAETGKCVNIKKGQFLAPWDMKNSIEKARSTGNNNITLTERGVSFGYNMLVVDMCAIPVMQQLVARLYSMRLIPCNALAGLETLPVERGSLFHTRTSGSSCRADALFLEVHPDPPNAMCDAASMLSLADLPQLLLIRAVDTSSTKAVQPD